MFLLASPINFTKGENYTFVLKWGSSGIDPGAFDRPNGVAIDSSSYVYVADAANHRIQKFTEQGDYVLRWGNIGAGEGQFAFPRGVAVDNYGSVYVADTLNNRIQKFTDSGVFVAQWGSFGSEDGQFKSPCGVAVDVYGYIYVSDMGNYRIQKFTSTGSFVAKWGSSGNGASQFGNSPNVGLGEIAVDNSGFVYVADWLNSRVQKFDTSGNFVSTWGTRGANAGQFINPCGIAVDSDGYVYVSDFNASSVHKYAIQKFTSDGGFVTGWGTDSGSDDGSLINPTGVDVDSLGNVFVADEYLDRIQKFFLAPPSRVSNIKGSTIEAAFNQTYFIYADPVRMTRAVATYDVAAGSTVHGMCDYSQIQAFDSDARIVSQLSDDKGRLRMAGKTVLMFGGPRPHLCVNYLEQQRMTPVYFQMDVRQDGTHIKFIETSTLTAVVDRYIAGIDFDHEDYFVIESLVDTNGNTIFIAYGFDWKGTWASGITLKLIYPDIATYINAYYIFHWVDEDMDGIPDAPELYQVVTGN